MSVSKGGVSGGGKRERDVSDGMESAGDLARRGRAAVLMSAVFLLAYFFVEFGFFGFDFWLGGFQGGKLLSLRAFGALFSILSAAALALGVAPFGFLRFACFAFAGAYAYVWYSGACPGAPDMCAWRCAAWALAGVLTVRLGPALAAVFGLAAVSAAVRCNLPF